MKKLISVFAVVVLLGCVGTLLADPVTLTLVSINPGVGNVGVNNLSINGAPTIPGYCVDPGTSSIGAAYANYYLIPIPATGPTQALNGYLYAATIFENEGTSFATGQEAADVQNAIWYAMGMSWSGTAEAAAIYAAAVANPLTSLDNYMLAVSPDPEAFFGVAHQDFIIRTPEPSSLLLLGLGLLGFGLVRRKS